MNHQTFEKWAVTPESRSEDETKSFEAHRKECPNCNRLASNWEKIEKRLTAPSDMCLPKPGFTARFQASLAARKAAEQKRQVRKFLGFLSLSLILIIILGTIAFYNINPPRALLTQIFTLGAKMVVFFENIKIIASTFAKFTPFQFFIPGFMVISSAVIGLLIFWMTTLWRFSLQGGQQNG